MNENEKQSSLRIKRYRNRNKPYDRSENQNKSLFSRVSKKVSEFIPYTLQLLTNKVLNFSSIYGQSSDEANIPGQCGVEHYHDVCQSLDDYESYKPPLLPDSISGPSCSAVNKETLFSSTPFRVTPPQKKICDNIIDDHKRLVHLEDEIGDDNSSVTSSGCSSMIPHAHSDLLDEKNRIFNSAQNSLLLQASKNHIVHDKELFQKINQEENKSENLSHTEHDVLWSEISNNAKRNIQDSKCSKYEKINTSLVNNSLNSSFYSGRISFGGASANSRFMQRIPYQINVRKHVKSLATKDLVVPTLLSSTAQKVFDSLQNFTTPVSDAKKVPLYKNEFEQSGSHSKFLKSEGNRYHRDKSKRSGGPPLSLLSLNSFGHNAQGKIRNKLKNLHYSQKKQIAQKVNLPDVPLPVSDLNDLKLLFEKSKPCFSFSSPILHKPPQLSCRSESSEIFSFSSPIILPKSNCHEVKAVDEVKQISNGVSFKTFNSASTQSENNCSVCLLHAKDDCNYCNSQEKSGEISNILSDQTVNQKSFELNTEAHKILEFKKEVHEEKDWECDVCWVRNPNSQRSCLACETCRPGKPPEIGSYKFLEPVSSASFSVINNLTTSSDTAGVSFVSVPVTKISFPSKSQSVAFNNNMTYNNSGNQNTATEFPTTTSSNFVTSVTSSGMPLFGKLDSVSVASQKTLDSTVTSTDIPSSCTISTFDDKTNKSFSNSSEIENSSHLSEICGSDKNKSAFLCGDKSNESLSGVPNTVVSSVEHFDKLTAVKSSEPSVMKPSAPSTAFSFGNSVASSVTLPVSARSSKGETEVFKVPLETEVANPVPGSVSAGISFGTSVTSSIITPFSFGTSTTNSALPSASTGFSFGISAAKSTLPSSSTGFSFGLSASSSKSSPVSEGFSFETSVANTLPPQSSGGFTFRVNDSPATGDKELKKIQTFSNSDLNKSEISTGVKTNENTLGILTNTDVSNSAICDTLPGSLVRQLAQNDEKKNLQDDYSSNLFSFVPKESSEVKSSNLFKENFAPSNIPLSNVMQNNKNASMFTFGGESCSNISGGKMFEFQSKQSSSAPLPDDTTTTFSIFGKSQAPTSAQFSPHSFNFTSQSASPFNKLHESLVSDSQPGGSKPVFAASTSIFPKSSEPLPFSQSSQVFNNSITSSSTLTFGSSAFSSFSASNVFASNAQSSFNFGNVQSSGGFNFIQNKDNSTFSFKGAQQQKVKSDSQSRSNAGNPFSVNEGRVYKKAVRRLKKHS